MKRFTIIVFSVAILFAQILCCAEDPSTKPVAMVIYNKTSKPLKLKVRKGHTSELAQPVIDEIVQPDVTSSSFVLNDLVPRRVSIFDEHDNRLNLYNQKIKQFGQGIILDATIPTLSMQDAIGYVTNNGVVGKVLAEASALILRDGPDNSIAYFYPSDKPSPVKKPAITAEEIFQHYEKQLIGAH